MTLVGAFRSSVIIATPANWAGANQVRNVQNSESALAGTKYRELAKLKPELRFPSLDGFGPPVRAGRAST